MTLQEALKEKAKNLLASGEVKRVVGWTKGEFWGTNLFKIFKKNFQKRRQNRRIFKTLRHL